VKSLRDEEEMVHICEPEAGRNLSDDEEERSLEDLMNCQVGKVDFQIARWAIRRDQVMISRLPGGQNENSNCQEGNEMRSLEDLIDCQEGREEIPYCQVGKGEQMRLSESLMNSGMSLDQ
jgi:hypothetical protein